MRINIFKLSGYSYSPHREVDNYVNKIYHIRCVVPGMKKRKEWICSEISITICAIVRCWTHARSH